jgi:hypothetical protein
MTGDRENKTATSVAVLFAPLVPCQSRSPVSIINRFNRLTKTL